MRIPISRLAKELNLEAYQLREWEKRGWLGEVVKDPQQNQQRVYTDELKKTSAKSKWKFWGKD